MMKQIKVMKYLMNILNIRIQNFFQEIYIKLIKLKMRK